MKAKILIVLGVMVALLLVLTLAAVVLSGGSETSNQDPELQATQSEGEPQWDGSGKHVYNFQVTADDRRQFEVRQVTFSGLRGPEARAEIQVLYGGPKPQWLQPSQLRKTFTFTVFNAGRSSVPRVAKITTAPLKNGRGWETTIILPRVPIQYLKTNSTQILVMRVRNVMPRDLPLILQINAFPAPGYSLGDRSAEILKKRKEARAKKKAQARKKAQAKKKAQARKKNRKKNR